MAEGALVLVVDDTPDTLALLHDNLLEAGYTVLVATKGDAAIKICHEINPEIVLLDAVMPGMDGFEVCKKLKQDINTRHIPIIFMTGLTESEHIVAAFSAGAIDYVTKPLRSNEVIARLATHLSNARQMSRTQNAFDAFGQAAIAWSPSANKIVWQTPLSKQLLDNYFDKDKKNGEYDLSALAKWFDELNQSDEKKNSYKYTNARGHLIFTVAEDPNEEQVLILIREESEVAQIEALKMIFNLTKRESEVLHWAIIGKTDKMISQILNTSLRTVNKHMEHVLIKLGVESRTAAAAKAMNKLHRMR